jgi:hypothetical protein
MTIEQVSHPENYISQDTLLSILGSEYSTWGILEHL